MSDSFYIFVLPILVGLAVAYLPQEKRKIVYFIVGISLVGWVFYLTSGEQDKSTGGAVGLLVIIAIVIAVIGVLTTLVVVAIRKHFGSFFNSLKNNQTLHKYWKHITSVVVILCALMVGKHFMDKQSLNEKMSGKWYGLQPGPRSGPDQIVYFEFDGEGNVYKTSFPDYKSKSVDLTDVHVKFYNDSVMSLWFVEGNGYSTNFIISKENTSSGNYCKANIHPKSEYFVRNRNTLSEKEIKTFWNANILPIINLETKKIQEFTEVYELYYPRGGRIYNNVQSTSYLKNVFPKQLRTGLENLTYKDVNQVVLDDGTVLLVVYFLGVIHFDHDFGSYPDLLTDYNHFGLIFSKEDENWNLVTVNIVSNVDYAEEKEIVMDSELQRTQGVRDEMIRNSLPVLAKKYVFNTFYSSIINSDTTQFCKLTQFPVVVDFKYEADSTIVQDQLVSAFFKDDFKKQLSSEKFKWKDNRDFNEIKFIEGSLFGMELESFINSPVEINGEVLQKVTMSFKIIDGELKLVALKF